MGRHVEKHFVLSATELPFSLYYALSPITLSVSDYVTSVALADVHVERCALDFHWTHKT